MSAEFWVTQAFNGISYGSLLFLLASGLSLIFELKRKGKAPPIREILTLPAGVPRLIRLPGDQGCYVALETLIRLKTEVLFPRYEIISGGAFRVLRDSDIEIEEEAEDLVRYFRTAIKRRRRGRVVRLEFEPGMPELSSERTHMRSVREMPGLGAEVGASVSCARAGSAVTIGSGDAVLMEGE